MPQSLRDMLRGVTKYNFIQKKRRRKEHKIYQLPSKKSGTPRTISKTWSETKSWNLGTIINPGNVFKKKVEFCK